MRSTLTARATVVTAIIAAAAVLLPLASATARVWALNPQPLPPGMRALNPQPPGIRAALNPQPLPPGIYAPNHYLSVWGKRNLNDQGSGY